MSYPPSDHPDQRPRCHVCHRRPTDDTVCPACRDLMAQQLNYLLGAYGRLPLAQLPSNNGGERIRTSRSAPLPLRLDPLSLTAAGHADTDLRTAFIPATGTWTERRTILGEERDVKVHGILRDKRGRRVLTPVDDQAGVLPVPVWAKAWVADFRQALGHSAPAEPPLRLRPATPPPAPQVGPGWVRTPAARNILAQYLSVVRDASRREVARDVLALGPASIRDGKRVLPELAEMDPAAREWSIRYGEANQHLALAVDVKYLTTWLGEACERHPDICTFAESLKALHRAAQFVLGDGDDKAYLGRCPTGHHHNGHPVGRELRDRETGEPVVCGFPLWHEPHTSTIACPRCRTETGPRDYLLLAGHIRRAWPVDRRRRYTLEEANDIQRASAGLLSDLRMPCCDLCRRVVEVSWVRATERGDRESMWRVGGVTCPVRCVAGEDRLSA